MEAQLYDLNWKIDILLRLEEKQIVGFNLKNKEARHSKLGPKPKGGKVARLQPMCPNAPRQLVRLIEPKPIEGEVGL